MGMVEKMKALMGDAPAAGKAIGEKKKMIAQYTAAQMAKPLPKKPVKPAAVDKINPKAKYGDRPGEMRPEDIEAMAAKPGKADKTKMAALFKKKK